MVSGYNNIIEKTKKVIKSELANSKEKFLKLLNSLSDEDLKRKSKNPGWTNGEIVWHILFAFIILFALIPLIKFFSHLPKSVSKVFVDFLNFTTPIFNFINALGAKGGAKVLILLKKAIDRKEYTTLLSEKDCLMTLCH